MGNQTIPTRADDTTITDAWFDIFLSALSLNLVPRGADGVATTEAGSLGTTTENFRALQEHTGGYERGDFKLHLTYNGAVAAGGGFMLCDGRAITKENYDLEHGAGAWDIDVGSTPLEGLYLPDYCVGPAGRGRAFVGATATAHDGVTPFPSVGNPDHRADLSHTHQWSTVAGLTWIRNTFDFPATFGIGNWATANLGDGQAGFTPGAYSFDAWTDKKFSTTQGIKPLSNPAQIYMRVV